MRKYIRICEMVLIVLAGFLCACGKEGAQETSEIKASMRQYSKTTEDFYLPKEANEYSVQCNGNALFFISEEEKNNAYNIVKITKTSEDSDAEVLYTTNNYLYTYLYDEELIACEDSGEGNLLISRFSDVKSQLIIEDEAVDTYPIAIKKGKEMYYLLTGDSVYILPGDMSTYHRIKCMDGNLKDLAEVGEGRAAIIYNDSNDLGHICIVDANSKETKDSTALPFRVEYCFFDDGQIILTDNSCMYAFDEKDKGITKLFEFKSLGISASRIGNVVLHDKEILVVSNDQADSSKVKVYTLSESANNVVTDEKKKLFLYSSMPDFFDPAVIEDFNDESEQYELEMIISDENSIKDIMAQNIHPDLVWEIFPQNIENWGDSGYLEDLWPYIDNSKNLSRDDICEQVSAAFTKNGKLYGLSQYFQIGGILIDNSLVDFEGEWTVKEFLDWIERHPQLRCINGTSRYNILSICMKGIYSDFVDADINTAKFDSPEFADILNRICSMQTDSLSEQPLSIEEVEKQTEFMNECGFGDVTGIEMQRVRTGENLTFFGYPGVTSGTTTIDPYFGMGIFANSDCKEGAYEFLEFYLKYPERFMINATNERGTLYTLNECRHKSFELSKAGFEWGNGNGSVTICGTDEDINMLEEALSKAIYSDYKQSRVSDIVFEEFENIESGNSTVEHACDVIQSRVSILLSEMN